jgi:5'-nucleotidase
VILLVNDDGVEAPGLRALYRALRQRTGRPVLAVAPASERSGQSHAITIDRPLRVHAVAQDGFFGFAVDGTPTDAVKLALNVLCADEPELVVSGINDGPNVGRSLFYSGTIGAALEAAVLGMPTIAVSRMKGGEGFDDAAAFAAQWAERLLGKRELRGRLLSLNLPSGPAASWQAPTLARHGHSGFRETYQPTRDAAGQVAWRLHGEWIASADGEASDASSLHAGHPTLTALAPDLNADIPALQRLIARHLRH